jgi:acyl-CoA reductase-like NAD-dependent aldehyde dehydrogenase
LTEWPLWVDGAERSGRAGWREILLPYDGSRIAKVAEADEADLLAAVAAAKRAAKVMRALTRAQRATILRRVAELFEQQREELALTITRESGKPIREGRLEAERARQTLLHSAEAAHALTGEEVALDAAPHGARMMAMTVRDPLGVIAAITPFNFPLNLAMHKVGPALAAGNAVFLKPASATPLSSLLAARLFAEAGLPPGALNVTPAPGSMAGKVLAQHPDVAMLTFTGSYEVGCRLKEMAGMKRVTLELGSNSAAVILADADLRAAVSKLSAGAYAHSGQICISVQRVMVEGSVWDEVAERTVEAAASLRMGHPEDEATEVSSLIRPEEADRVMDWLGEGTPLLRPRRVGYASVTPAVLAQCPAEGRMMQGELFGPALTLQRVEDLAEAIAQVNESPYGLQASVFTRDLQRAFAAARAIEAGAVLINESPSFRADHMPYGGVKHSGSGREGPAYAAEEMTELRLIAWRL